MGIGQQGAQRLLSGPLAGLLVNLGTGLLYRDAIRRGLVQLADRWLRREPAGRRDSRPWNVIEQQRRLIYASALHSLDRLAAQRILTPAVARAVLAGWLRALAGTAERRAAIERFRRRFGCAPPWFLVISPTHACNLRCSGCYANSGSAGAPSSLPWSTLDRLMGDAKANWGVPLFVFSGGEPLLYRSEGKDLLDAVEKHADCLYLMFTNGTLIDRALAQRLARLGVLTPALSVEGWRERTDARRGAGLFDRVLAAMACLREAGVPFGISITVTRDNADEVLADDFLHFFFEQQGAFYTFLFQFSPIGRASDMELTPTPDQRAQFWRRAWDVVERQKFFLLDFWNHGPLVEGCIAAGRERGYLYVDWNGKIMPCVFAPYAAGNLADIYPAGQNLDAIWEAPFFRAIRQWQSQLGYGQRNLPAETNWLHPCPFRDYYPQFRQWIECYRPEPEDDEAAQAAVDDAYAARIIAQAATQRPASDALWAEHYRQR